MKIFPSASRAMPSTILQVALHLEALELLRATAYKVLGLFALTLTSTSALADGSSIGETVADIEQSPAQIHIPLDDDWASKISIRERDLDSIAAKRFAGFDGFDKAWANLSPELRYLLIALPFDPKSGENLRVTHPGAFWEPIEPNPPNCKPNCPPPNFELFFEASSTPAGAMTSAEVDETVQALNSGEFETIYGLSWKWMQASDIATAFSAVALPGVTKPDTLGYAYALTQDSDSGIGYSAEAIITLKETTKAALGADLGSADFKAVFDLVQGYRAGSNPTSLAAMRFAEFDGLDDAVLKLPFELRKAALKLPVGPSVEAPVYPNIPKCRPKCPRPVFIMTDYVLQSDSVAATLSAIDGGEIKTLYGLSWKLMETSNLADKFRDDALPGATNPDTLGYLYALARDEAATNLFDPEVHDSFNSALKAIFGGDFSGKKFEYVFSTIQTHRAEAILAE